MSVSTLAFWTILPGHCSSDIFYWQILERYVPHGNVPDRTVWHLSSVSSSPNYFRIHATVGSAGCTEDWRRHRNNIYYLQDENNRTPLFPFTKNCSSAKSRRPFISHDQQRQTYLQGARSQFDTKQMVPGGLSFCKCPVAHTNVGMSHRFCEKSDSITQGEVMEDGTDLTNFIVYFYKLQSTTSKREERKMSL